MQVGMHQLFVFKATGTMSTRICPQFRSFGVVLAVLAIQILGIRNRQSQAPAGRRPKEHLGVAYTSSIDDFRQSVCKNKLTFNIFELHDRFGLIYKYTKYI